MPDVYRTQVVLSNWTGGPGVNTFHWTAGSLTGTDSENAAAFMDEIMGIYTAVDDLLIGGVVATPTGIVQRFDEADGTLLEVGAYDTTGMAVTMTTSATSSKLSRATQAVVALVTDQIRGQRVLQGRTYLGPLASVAIAQSGQLESTTLTTINNAFAAVTSGLSGRLAVWGQPSEANPVGKVGDVVTVACRSKPGILSSRRDS